MNTLPANSTPAARKVVAPAPQQSAAFKLPAVVATAIAVLFFSSPRIMHAAGSVGRTGTMTQISAPASLSSAALGQFRLAALSQIESGDNDRAVGGVGELSRWQVRPEILKANGINRTAARNPAVVRPLVVKLLQARCGEFAARHGRAPSDFEFYVLWNAPAQVLAPSRRVSERAQRFANLTRALRANA